MEDHDKYLNRMGRSDIDILNEIYNVMKVLYYRIVKVELASNIATILISIHASEIGNTFAWEEYLKSYVVNYIRSSDRMCVLVNFCSENLKRCISQGRRWFSCNAFCTADSGEKHVTISAIVPYESSDNQYAYVLVRNADIAHPLQSGNDIIAVYTEEEKRREMEKVLKRVQTDPLTRLLNFQATTDKINERLSDSGKRYALLYIDIDNFKQINDMFGHPVGDRILRNIADNIVDNSSKNDIVGRVGGDEFVFFTEAGGMEEPVDIIARKICCAISSVKIRAGLGESNVTGSVGIAIAPDDGADYDTLVTKAVQGVYAAKKSGKNIHSF